MKHYKSDESSGKENSKEEMKGDLEEIKAKFDRNYSANQETRRRAADDRVFSWVTQWDDTLLEDTENAYRGEFNIIRKGTRHIIADLRANPVQVDFEPKDDTREDGADLLDGLYLTDDRRNSSIEAYDNASMEAVDCGVGGWELYTEYENMRNGDSNQVIRRRPIYEANNVSFPDSNAKMMDKSDAMNWGVLEPYSREGYCRLIKELCDEDVEPDGLNVSNFASPEKSYVFPWIQGGNDLIYVCRWYERELVKDVVLTLEDDNGDSMRLLESQVKEVMDELIDQGYSIVDEKQIKRWKVERYIVSGERILEEKEIAGEHIPIVHAYGERTFVEGEEIWEGAVRLAKDPQRLRNFLLSYLAEITTRSPRPKPMFTPEEVAGHQWMYEKGGADNNYAYYLYNAIDANGNPIERSRELMPRAEMPAGIAELAAETRAAVEDVVNPGTPGEFADTQLSGYAIEQMSARFDQQSLVYQQNMKHAKRWDAEIYAGMACVVYDAPRKVTVTGRDGSRNQIEVMSAVIDEQSGMPVILNDITNAEFEVFAEVGQSYSSKRERTREHLENLAEKFMQVDPNLAKIMGMQALTLVDGVGMDGIRDYIRKQLIMQGVQEPETDEEKAMMEQAQQSQQPDAMQIAAQAEQLKAEAETGMFEAQTKRYAAQTDAEYKGVKSGVDQAKTINLQADTMSKLRGSATAANEPMQQQPQQAPVRRMRLDQATGQLQEV